MTHLPTKAETQIVHVYLSTPIYFIYTDYISLHERDVLEIIKTPRILHIANRKMLEFIITKFLISSKIDEIILPTWTFRYV